MYLVKKSRQLVEVARVLEHVFVEHGHDNEEIQGLPGNPLFIEQTGKGYKKLVMPPGTQVAHTLYLHYKYTLTNSTSQNIQIYIDIFESLKSGIIGLVSFPTLTQ